MFVFLVALDGSANANKAFETALGQSTPEDKVYLTIGVKVASL